MQKIGNKKRIIGFDLARALAIMGMILVNYKMVLNSSDNSRTILSTFNNMFEGRAAAVFLVLAGIGLSLMTKKHRESNNPAMWSKAQVVICKRAVFLLIVGLTLYSSGWSADILHYYGAFMLITSLLISKSDKTLILFNIGVLFASEVLLLILNYEAGWSADFMHYIDFWTLKGFIRNLFFNGYHPIFPWITFMVTGILLGRQNLLNKEKRRKILQFSLMIALVTEIFSAVAIRVSSKYLETDIATFIFDTKPMPPNLLYIIAGTSTAIAVIILCLNIAEALKSNILLKALVKTGQMALTHYIGHVIIGLGILEILGMLGNRTLLFSTMYSIDIYVCMVVFSYLWGSKFKRGPLEYVMRKISG